MKFQYKSKVVTIELPEGTGNVVKTIKKGRFYEQKLLEYIAKLHIEGVYVDVGANIGNHSIFFGMFTNATSVQSFEPHPEMFKFLKSNIAHNNLGKKVKIYNVALADKNGKCSLEIVPTDQIGGSKVIRGGDIDQWKLDKFADENIALIKVDVEGYEEFVIRGAEVVLSKHKPELFLELTNHAQYRTVSNIISKFGYKPIAVFNNSATFHFSTKLKPGALYHVSKIYPVRRLFLHS